MTGPTASLIVAIVAIVLLVGCRGEEWAADQVEKQNTDEGVAAGRELAADERLVIDPAVTFDVGTSGDPAVGPVDAPIVVVEFTDYSRYTSSAVVRISRK